MGKNVGTQHGNTGPDLNEQGVDAAAQELLIAAGRPEGWPLTSEYEKDAWRHAARRVMRAYRNGSA